MSGIVSFPATPDYRRNYSTAFKCRRCGANAGERTTGQRFSCLSCDRPAASEEELEAVARKYCNELI